MSTITKSFAIDTNEDGSAKLSLSYKDARQNGLMRISCELTPGDLTQIVLFAETLSLRLDIGCHDPFDLTLDGLELRYDPSISDIIIERQVGFSTQSAPAPLQEFLAEMSGVADLCLGSAEDSKHGDRLKSILRDWKPEPYLENTPPSDQEEAIHYRLAEIGLLILAPEAGRRGSEVGQLLRSKKTQEEARQEVHRLMDMLANEIMPSQNSTDAAPLSSSN